MGFSPILDRDGERERGEKKHGCVLKVGFKKVGVRLGLGLWNEAGLVTNREREKGVECQ